MALRAEKIKPPLNSTIISKGQTCQKEMRGFVVLKLSISVSFALTFLVGNPRKNCRLETEKSVSLFILFHCKN